MTRTEREHVHNQAQLCTLIQSKDKHTQSTTRHNCACSTHRATSWPEAKDGIRLLLALELLDVTVFRLLLALGLLDVTVSQPLLLLGLLDVTVFRLLLLLLGFLL